MLIKLSEYALKYKVTYRTAWNWLKRGLIRSKIIKTPTNRILIELKENKIKRKEFNVAYARVSSGDQKTTLDSQVNEIREDCRKKNITIHKIVTEIGSGLNGRRVKFNRLLQERKVTNIIATQR